MSSESTDAPSDHPFDLDGPVARREQPSRTAVYWAGTLLAVAIGGWLTLPAWGPAPPAGDDVAAHVVRADFAFDHIFGRGRLDGWFPRFMVGHQEFLFYGQGYTWLVGLARLATFGLLSTIGAVKAVGIAGFVGLGPAVMFLARSFGVRAPAAAAAGLLALAVDNPFGVGLHSTYVIGLLPNQIAAVAFCVAIGAAARTVRQHGRGWVVLTAVTFSFLALTHVISAGIAVAFLALALIALVVGRDVAPRWWARVAGAGALALGLTAFWAVPFLVHRELRGPVTAWSTPGFLERIDQVVAGEVLFPATLSIIVIACLVTTMWIAPRSLALLAVIPPLYLSLAHTILAVAPGNPVAIQLPNRGLGYAGLFALIPVGIVVDRTAGWIGGRVRPRRPRRAEAFGRWATLTVASVGAIYFAVPARDVVAERPEPTDAFAALAAEVRAAVPAGDRFATERDYPAEISRAGFTHPDLWLAEMSGQNTLNNFNPESAASPAGFVTEGLTNSPPAELARSLVRYGVSHVVTVRPDTASRLAASGRYELLWRRDDFALFAVVAPGRVGPLRARDLDGDISVAEPERVLATVALPRPRRVTAALSWTPKWEVRVDGDPVVTRPSSDRIVSFALPSGTSEVELRFRRDRWDLLGRAVSLGALGLAAYLSLPSSMSSLISRRRSRTA